MTKIEKGSVVRATNSETVPARYRGRVGRVVSKARVGYLVNFPQRTTPLAVRRDALVSP
jgi:hypothetical protein